ncbi:flagellar hook-associated protein FlgK [Marivita sp.]|uniref:flagellar hook-associated protein FlgK n=1 Tax=Marivita sp. TaxID=2003365 RepID=UPI002626C04E|nr:flagellar hook-associated protein FlgK [Marivita sp.]
MSLSGALSNAMSGLVANARGTTVISSNIANALNENYGRRDISLSTNATQTSGGVIVANVTRHADPILAYQKRLALADHSAASAQSDFQATLEQLIGSVDTIGSVAEKLTRFETALLSAASDPSSETRLRNISVAAEAFAGGLRDTSAGIDALRTRADADIAKTVDRLNSGLSQLEQLNAQIMTARHLGQDAHGLMDRRDATLDALAEFVPLHVVERDSGKIAVFTAQGRTLLDERAVTFGFAPTSTILPHMTVENGLLSGMTINGKPVSIPGNGMVNGGSLEAQFNLRDVSAPQMQKRLDAIARDAIERFGPGGPDTTLGVTDPGILTDNGLNFDVANETGLAGRITLNAALWAGSSEPWRWRDGLNATAQGDVGQSDLLLRMKAQLNLAAVPGSTVLGSAPRSLVDHLQELSNTAAAQRVGSEEAHVATFSRLTELRDAAASDGVNTDQELQKLIELEKSYAANARVVQVVDDMLSELLRI